MLGTERTGPDLSQEGGVAYRRVAPGALPQPALYLPKSIMPEFSFYYSGQRTRRNQEIIDLIAYVQAWAARRPTSGRPRQKALKQKLLDERAKGNEAIIHEWFPRPGATCATRWSRRSARWSTARGLHDQLRRLPRPAGRRQGPGRALVVNNPAPRNFTDARPQLLFSDGEMYDAILFGVDGTAMPAWGDMLTVNDIWDVTNFLRTIPNGGLKREPTADMMVSAPDDKPIELTPPAAAADAAARRGLGQTGQATPGARLPRRSLRAARAAGK